MNFDEAFVRLLGNEGSYSNDPQDPGGETMWGITRAVAYECGYRGDMKAMTQGTAKAIYQGRYWNAVRAEELPAEVRFDVFDAAVNSGPVQATKWLQQALGVAADGVIGPQTLAAVKSADGARLSKRINSARLRFMTDLPTWKDFGRGWARRIASNMEV